jgi:DNA-binding CsgD family transcriptional regulator
MFMSPATVADHLRNVSRKLDITSRAHVQDALEAPD